MTVQAPSLRPPVVKDADAPRIEPFGPTTRRRQLAGAMIVMAGALPVALLADSHYGRPPRLHMVLVAIGAVAMVAWLVDGRRYVGAGSASLALGLAFTFITQTGLDPYFLMFGLLGASLLLVARVNPKAVSGSAGLLIYVALNAVGLHRADATILPRAWVFAIIMLAWGGSRLRRTLAIPGRASLRFGSGAIAAD